MGSRINNDSCITHSVMHNISTHTYHRILTDNDDADYSHLHPFVIMIMMMMMMVRHD